MKDVYFNKEKMFNGNTKSLKCNMKNISLKYLVNVIKKAIYITIITALPITYNDTAKDLE